MECRGGVFSISTKKKIGGVEQEYLKICLYENQEDQTLKSFGIFELSMGSTKNQSGKMLIVIQPVTVEDF